MNLGSNPRPCRPLLMVEAANPEWTSVPLVGWNMARAIAQRTNAHMVTHVRNRDAILRAGLVDASGGLLVACAPDSVGDVLHTPYQSRRYAGGVPSIEPHRGFCGQVIVHSYESYALIIDVSGRPNRAPVEFAREYGVMRIDDGATAKKN